MENRLIQVTDASGALAAFEYDGDGAWTKRHAGDATVGYHNRYWELDLPRLWAGATVEERRRLLLTVLDDVYVETNGEKQVVVVSPKPAFRDLSPVVSSERGYPRFAPFSHEASLIVSG